MEQEGLASVEPTREAEDQWVQSISDGATGTLFLETDSWWTGANVPGKKREILTYLGGIQQYEPECRAALQEWKGFSVREQKKV